MFSPKPKTWGDIEEDEPTPDEVLAFEEYRLHSSSEDSFNMEILRDLISQGFNGDELLAKFAEKRADIKRAIGLLIDEVDEIAENQG